MLQIINEGHAIRNNIVVYGDQLLITTKGSTHLKNYYTVTEKELFSIVATFEEFRLILFKNN